MSNVFHAFSLKQREALGALLHLDHTLDSCILAASPLVQEQMCLGLSLSIRFNYNLTK